jgi:hypothetical protein
MAKVAVKTKSPPQSLLVVHDVEQGSPEWLQARLGIVTASHFGTVMADGRDGGPSVTRTRLLYRLAFEQITGEPAEEGFRSAAMDRGRILEDEARLSYCRRKKVEARQVGFATNFSGLKFCGASPDSLIGFDGGLEIKTAKSEIIIPMLKLPAKMPPEHRCQVQGNMLVFERDWWDITVYCHRSMPAMDVRVYRDNVFIKELSNQIEQFNWELKNLVDSLKNMGAAG